MLLNMQKQPSGEFHPGHFDVKNERDVPHQLVFPRITNHSSLINFKNLPKISSN